MFLIFFFFIGTLSTHRRLSIYHHQFDKRPKIFRYDEKRYIYHLLWYIFNVGFPGHPEYGCFISPDKTLTNFDHDDQLLNVVDPSQRSISFYLLFAKSSLWTRLWHSYSAFPWCGYAIDMKDLSIMVDYSRYKNSGNYLSFFQVLFWTALRR